MTDDSKQDEINNHGGEGSDECEKGDERGKDEAQAVGTYCHEEGEEREGCSSKRACGQQTYLNHPSLVHSPMAMGWRIKPFVTCSNVSFTYLRSVTAPLTPMMLYPSFDDEHPELEAYRKSNQHMSSDIGNTSDRDGQGPGLTWMF